MQLQPWDRKAETVSEDGWQVGDRETVGGGGGVVSIGAARGDMGRWYRKNSYPSPGEGRSPPPNTPPQQVRKECIRRR